MVSSLHPGYTSSAPLHDHSIPDPDTRQPGLRLSTINIPGIVSVMKAASVLAVTANQPHTTHGDNGPRLVYVSVQCNVYAAQEVAQGVNICAAGGRSVNSYT